MSKRKSSSPVRYAIYLRCSTDDQKEGDYTTIDTQREINTQHVLQSGGILIRQYADAGRTGTNLNRSGWQELLRDAQDGKFDAVCVTYMSRLGRGNAFIIAEHELKKCGVRVETVREKFSDDMMGYVTKQMTNLMDGMYPKMVSQWTKTKQQQMVERGYFTGGIHPFGYHTVAVADAGSFHSGDKEPPKRLVPHPDEAPLVRRAYTTFVETGSISLTGDYLRSVTERRWSHDTVKYLLLNEVYRGVLRFGEWVNYTAHEAIVSEALWDQAQEKMTKRAHTRSPKQKPKDTTAYYLRGLVWCPHCGCRMTPADHHGRAAQSLHEAVLREIQRGAEHSTRMAELIREAVKALPKTEDQRAEQKAVIRRLRETDQKISRLTTVIENSNSKTPMQSLLARLAELEQQRDSLEAEQRRLEQVVAASTISRPDATQVQRLWGRVLELWEAATEDERSRLLGLLVERVEMKEKEHGFCRLVFSAEKPCPREDRPDVNVGLNPYMGAGLRVGSIYPGSFWFSFDAPAGGKNRKKEPRPWQKADSE